MSMSTETNSTEVQNKPAVPKLIAQLRELAAKDEYKAVFKAFAARERTRQQVTLDSLFITMMREGSAYARDQYAEVLKTLAHLGVGTLELDSKKRVVALKNIKITLQSIGMAALGTRSKLDKFIPDPAFIKLPVIDQKEEVKMEQQQQKIQPPKEVKKAFAAALTVNFDGGPVTFPLPRQLTAEEISELLAKLYRSQN